MVAGSESRGYGSGMSNNNDPSPNPWVVAIGVILLLGLVNLPLAYGLWSNAKAQAARDTAVRGEAASLMP